MNDSLTDTHTHALPHTHTHAHTHSCMHTHTHTWWVLSDYNGSDQCETCLCMWRAHVLYITVAPGCMGAISSMSVNTTTANVFMYISDKCECVYFWVYLWLQEHICAAFPGSAVILQVSNVGKTQMIETSICTSNPYLVIWIREKKTLLSFSC